MRVVATPKALDLIGRRGGRVWVWLDPHQWAGGGYTWLETHCEPPGTSRKSRFTRSSRRPHRFRRMDAEGFELNVDFGTFDPPEELVLDVKGLLSKRVEAYWNGGVFVGTDPLADDT